MLSDNWQVVEILVDSGADLNKNDLHFGSPLHTCAFRGHVRSAEILLRAG